MNEIRHFGIFGMHWGIRREQSRLAKEERNDAKWVTKGKGSKITDKVQRTSSEEAKRYALGTTQQPFTSSGKVSRTFINQYNKKLAQLMNERVGDISAPSGKILRYVSKRGEIGVHTALADQGYNMDQVAKGIYASGRIAYKQETIRQT